MADGLVRELFQACRKTLPSASIDATRIPRTAEIAPRAHYVPPEKHFDGCGPRWEMGAEMEVDGRKKLRLIEAAGEERGR